MSYNGFVVKVKNLRPHTNADRLQIATFFGNDTCVGLDVKVGDLGIYFPSDGQLSEAFCIENHLLRELPDGTKDTGYMDPKKRNVTAIRLRGERSDGIYMNISCLKFTGVDISTFKEGDMITSVNGIEICKKYIPQRNNRSKNSQPKAATKSKKILAPLFKEHADTQQLAYNMNAFKPGDQIEITLKMHGTSQRTGYLPVAKRYKKTLLDRILRRPGKPIYEWDYISGTRRCILKDFDGGFYGSNAFRKQHEDAFVGKLYKNETVYYEVVGFTDTGVPIMGSVGNKKLNDKEFIKKYGDTTVFSYGCAPAAKEVYTQTYGTTAADKVQNVIKPVSDIYVYRMTMTNEDGVVVEYTPDFMRYRCEQMGVKTVPVFWKGFIPEDLHSWKFINKESMQEMNPTPGDFVLEKAEEFYDGPDPIGQTHIREGVVVRIINRPKFEAYKHKNFNFKLLEGIIKVEAEAPDMEEAEEEFKENDI